MAFSEILEAFFNFLIDSLGLVFDKSTDLIMDFMSSRIPSFKNFGVKVLDVFDSIPLSSDALSFDFIYFFIGFIAFIFIFKLVWSLISNLLS